MNFGHTVSALDFSLDGTELAVGDRSGLVSIFSFPVLQQKLAFYPKDHEPVQAMGYSPTGKTLCVSTGWDSDPWPGNPSGRLSFFRLPDYKLTKKLAWFWGVPRSFSFDPSGRHVVVGEWCGSGGAVSVWRAD